MVFPIIEIINDEWWNDNFPVIQFSSLITLRSSNMAMESHGGSNEKTSMNGERDIAMFNKTMVFHIIQR